MGEMIGVFALVAFAFYLGKESGFQDGYKEAERKRSSYSEG